MSSFAKGVLSLSLGNVVAQLIAIAAVPVITRLYSPADYGLYAVFLSLTMVLYPLSTLRYHPAVMLPASNGAAMSVVKLSLVAVFCTSLLILFVSGMVWLIDQKLFGLGSYGRPEVLFLLPLSIALHGALLVVVQWVIRKKAFGIVSVSRIFGSVADRSGTILLSFFQFGALGLILGRILGPLVSLLFIFKKRGLDNEVGRESSFFTGVRGVAFRYKDFPLYSMTSTLFIAFSRELPIFLLASLFSSGVTGLYALGVRIVNMPMMVIGDSISFAFFQKISEMKVQGEDPRNIVIRLLESLLCIIFPVMLFLMVFGSELFAIIFGQEWFQAGRYVEILGLAFVAMFIHRPLATIYDTYEKQRERLVFSVFLLVVRGGAVVVAFAIDDSALFVVRVLAVTTVIIYLCSMFYLFKVVQLGLLEMGKKVTKKICLLIPSIAGLPFIKYAYGDELLWALVFAGLLLLLQYVAIIMTDHYLRDILNRRVFSKVSWF